jgi:hypothetical protein
MMGCEAISGELSRITKNIDLFDPFSARVQNVDRCWKVSEPNKTYQ